MQVVRDQIFNSIQVTNGLQLPQLVTESNQQPGNVVYNAQEKNIAFFNGSEFVYVAQIPQYGTFTPVIIPSGLVHSLVDGTQKGYFSVVGSIVTVNISYRINFLDSNNETQTLSDYIQIPTTLNHTFSAFDDAIGVCQLGLSNNAQNYFGSFILSIPNTNFLQVSSTLEVQPNNPDTFVNISVSFPLSIPN
jgi:hypothetical protein